MYHAIIDLRFPRSIDLSNNYEIQDAMTTALKCSDARVLDVKVHEFEPYGLSILFLLAESHASIHTEPETGSAYIDFFTCVDESKNVYKFIARIIELFSPEEVNIRVIDRGFGEVW